MGTMKIMVAIAQTDTTNVIITALFTRYKYSVRLLLCATLPMQCGWSLVSSGGEEWDFLSA